MSATGRELVESPQPTREELLRRADLARAHLLETVSELERRRHDAFDVRRQIRRHTVALVLAGSTTVLLVGLVVAWMIVQERRSRRSPYVAALGRMWRHPDWIARPRSRSRRAGLARGVAKWVVTPLVRAVFVSMAQSARQRWRTSSPGARLPAASPPRIP